MLAVRILNMYALFVFVLGIIGYFRTDSWMPVIISTAIAVITVGLIIAWRQNMPGARSMILGWLVICLAAFLGSAFDMMPGHQAPQPGYRIIFLSEAAFALVAILAVMRSGRPSPPNKPVT